MLVLAGAVLPVPVTWNPSRRRLSAVRPASPAMPVPFSTRTRTWPGGKVGRWRGHSWPLRIIWKSTSSCGSSGSRRSGLAGSVTVGIVMSVTSPGRRCTRDLARLISLLTELRPWSTVSAWVAVLAILSSWIELPRMPWLLTFWTTEEMNACCSWIRGRSPPASEPLPTPCLVLT